MSREIERERAQMRELKDLLLQGEITRRDFLGRAGALGIAVTAATSMWGSSALASTPKQGGTLRQALRGGATSDTLEGGALLDTHNINTSWQVRNTLTEVTNTGELVGELAESWEASDDASVWTFRLRKGVEFHNGKTLDAEDVIDTLNQHRGEDSTSAAKSILGPVQDITADGANTVVTILEEGNADFPFMLADYHLIVAPAGTRGKDWDKGIGTGPFVLTEWEPGVRSATKRNPNYFKEGRPYFDGVESLNISGQIARTNALRTGDVDAMEDPDLKTLHLLERIPGMKVLEAGGTKHYSMPMRTDTAPFDDNNVRLALKHAVDRQMLLKTILRGRGYLGNDHPIGRPQRFFASDIPQRNHDPDKAKFHLRQAGLSELTVQLSAADIYAGGTDTAVLYKEQAASAGINIEIVPEPTDGYWDNVWRRKPWCISFWSGRATSDWMFATAYSANAEWNDSYWKHERFNQLLKQARAELDENRRREMYAECQQLVRDEGGVVIPVFANLVAVVDEKVGTPETIAGNWAMDGNKNHERWWFV